jgi:hypothetical protein
VRTEYGYVFYYLQMTSKNKIVKAYFFCFIENELFHEMKAYVFMNIANYVGNP